MRNLRFLIVSTAFLSASFQLALAQSPSEARKAAQQKFKEIEGKTGGASKSNEYPLPSGDPCSVFPLSDVKKLLPKVTKAVRETSLEKYGIVQCVWSGKDDVVVGGMTSSLEPDSALSEARSAVNGFVDPTKPGAAKNVRIEVFPSVGVDNAAFVEFADPKRYIIGNGAALFLANGKINMMLTTNDIQGRDRATLLKTLEELAKVGAKSLK